jgi:hypothetical protein
MPAGDGRGPNGAAMTGRGAGFCAGNSVPGYTAGGRGRGFNSAGRWNCRGGRGWRNRFYATGRPFFGRGFQNAPWNPQFQQNEYSAEAELKMLKDEAASINERIRELEAAALQRVTGKIIRLVFTERIPAFRAGTVPENIQTENNRWTHI